MPAKSWRPVAPKAVESSWLGTNKGEGSCCPGTRTEVLHRVLCPRKKLLLSCVSASIIHHRMKSAVLSGGTRAILKGRFSTALRRRPDSDRGSITAIVREKILDACVMNAHP